MDAKTVRFFQNLSLEAADRFKFRIESDEVMKEMKERAEKAYAKTGNREIKRQLDKGVYEVKDKIVIEEKTKREMDRFYDYRIRRAIRTGEIPPPKNDRFIKMLRRKLR